MTHADAFLRAILENPADDAPRAAYADWLQERGDPYGEFIAVQLALAGMRPAESCVREGAAYCRETPGRARRGVWCQRCRLRLRQKALLKMHGGGWVPNWFAGSYSWPHASAVTTADHFGAKRCVFWHFARGFVEEVAGDTPRLFLDHAAATFRAHPVTRVRLWQQRPTYSGTEPPGWFWTYDDEGDDRFFNNVIPRVLFGRLPPQNRHHLISVFDTEEAGQAAFSDACVAHGRDLAELPPLPLPQKVTLDAAPEI